MAFRQGERDSKLKVIGKTEKSETGTTVKFWPEPKYFDSPKISGKALKHLLQAKAVLCPGLRVRFKDCQTEEENEWYYEGGLKTYLLEQITHAVTLPPEEPFEGFFEGREEIAHFAVLWTPENSEVFQESYVNLVPTKEGGTHVNGLRTGLLEAMREFCEFRNLLPRGIKLAPEDVWDKINLH